MNRGSTLVEMSAMLGVAAILFAGAFEGLVRLQRLAAVDPLIGARAEMACSQLRRDLTAGTAEREGAGLRISIAADRPAVRWQVEDGQLVRDGCLQTAVSAFAVEQTGDRVLVRLTPKGLPERRIEGQP